MRIPNRSGRRLSIGTARLAAHRALPRSPYSRQDEGPGIWLAADPAVRRRPPSNASRACEPCPSSRMAPPATHDARRRCGPRGAGKRQGQHRRAARRGVSLVLEQDPPVGRPVVGWRDVATVQIVGFHGGVSGKGRVPSRSELELEHRVRRVVDGACVEEREHHAPRQLAVRPVRIARRFSPARTGDEPAAAAPVITAGSDEEHHQRQRQPTQALRAAPELARRECRVRSPDGAGGRGAGPSSPSGR